MKKVLLVLLSSFVIMWGCAVPSLGKSSQIELLAYEDFIVDDTFSLSYVGNAYCKINVRYNFQNQTYTLTSRSVNVTFFDSYKNYEVESITSSIEASQRISDGIVEIYIQYSNGKEGNQKKTWIETCILSF